MSSDAPAVLLEHVSKRYLLRGRPRQLKATLLALPRLLVNGARGPDFWALRDISLTLRHGECLGIIGANGSGKSTLLRIVARLTQPTTGRVVTNGRVSTMLELGAGFHPQTTGRENALLNAVLMGLSMREAQEALPGIIEFSELGEFIDQPMRTYSSGMYMRLGFAVAVHVRPQILLVDEVLAVGDAEFQQKCYAHIETLRAQGVTIMIASHDLQAIQRYTDRAILLDHGRIVKDGRPAEVIHEYLVRAFPPMEEAEATR